MSKIRLEKSVFERLEGLGFKHHGYFMSHNGDESGDYGESHSFTHKTLLIKLECKFSWNDQKRPWTYGFHVRDGKYAWSWCDWPNLESCLSTLGTVLSGACAVGNALEDPLRCVHRPKNVEPLLVQMVFRGLVRNALIPSDFPVGFHFSQRKRRPFFEKYFRGFGRRMKAAC